MPSAAASKLLMVSIGNPLRSDDGVALFIQKKLEQESFSRVSYLHMQQLNPELLEDLEIYEAIVLIDAACDGEDVALKKIGFESSRRPAFSHHLSAELFASLSRQIYGRELNLYVCSVKGDHFELGDILTPGAYERAGRAVELLKKFIKEHHYA